MLPPVEREKELGKALAWRHNRVRKNSKGHRFGELALGELVTFLWHRNGGGQGCTGEGQGKGKR